MTLEFIANVAIGTLLVFVLLYVCMALRAIWEMIWH
jgi:hypothetical protein